MEKRSEGSSSFLASKIKIFYSLHCIRALSIPIIILFILSFLFLLYSDDKLIQGIFLLALLGIFNVCKVGSYKIDETKLNNLLYFFSLVILIFLSFFLELLHFVFIFSISFVHALVYHIKSNKKYSIQSIFLVFLISMTFSFVITFIFIVFYAYIFLPLIGTTGILQMIMILSPLVILLIVSYIRISISLLKKSLGEFDYGAFFRFKHFPFSLINISSSKENIKKSIIKTTAVIFIILLFLQVVVITVLGVAFVNNVYSSVSSDYAEILEELPEQGTISSFYDEDLKKTNTFAEINSKRSLINEEVTNKKIISQQSLKDKLLYFYSGKIYDYLVDYIIFMTKLGLSLNDVKIKETTLIAEYQWIKKNQLNNTIFYDDSYNIDEHKQNIQRNIDKLYPMINISIYEEETKKSATYFLYTCEGCSLFSKIKMRVGKNLDTYESIEKLDKELSDSRNRFFVENIKNIKKETERVGIQEGGIDKSLRLKIIETSISNQIINNCRDDMCKKEVTSITKNPEFCKSLEDEEERDKCMLDYSNFDKTVCIYIKNVELKKDCLKT